MYPFPLKGGFSKNYVIIGITDNPTIIDSEIIAEVTENLNSPVAGPDDTWVSKANYINYLPTIDPTPLTVGWGQVYPLSVGYPYILIPNKTPNFGQYYYYNQFGLGSVIPLDPGTPIPDDYAHTIYKAVTVTYAGVSYICYKSIGPGGNLDMVIAPTHSWYHTNLENNPNDD